jgi:3-hydroxyacyl-[acyl-carrier-protein] dehydratase
VNSKDIHEILEYLPHRYPFLLIDRILDYEKDVSLTALKNVTVNEPFFPGHYPNRPVMPGVLLIEVMAQAAALLAGLSADVKGGNSNLVYYFVGTDKVRFKRPVEPGDQLEINVTLDRKVRGMWFCSASITVDGEKCTSCTVMFTAKEV